jgi:hypothetical protein
MADRHAVAATRRRVRVDLTGSNASGLRSVEYEGEWNCTDARLRELAAAHCQVPLDQVGPAEAVASDGRAARART